MKGKILLGVIGGICAGVLAHKYKKEIKEKVIDMKDKAVEVACDIYEKLTEEDELDVAIKEVKERKLTKIKNKDDDEALEEFNDMKFKEEVKKGLIVGGAGLGLGMVVIAFGFVKYKL